MSRQDQRSSTSGDKQIPFIKCAENLQPKQWAQFVYEPEKLQHFDRNISFNSTTFPALTNKAPSHKKKHTKPTELKGQQDTISSKRWSYKGTGALRRLKYGATGCEKWHCLPPVSCLNLGTKGAAAARRSD